MMLEAGENERSLSDSHPSSSCSTDFSSIAAASSSHSAIKHLSARKLRQFWSVGIALICLGVLSFLLQILSIVTQASAFRLGAVVWCGSFFVVSGFLTAISATRLHSTPAIAHLLFWIFFSASVCCPVLLILTLYTLAAELVRFQHRCALINPQTHVICNHYRITKWPAVAINLALLLVDILVFTLQVWTAITACRVLTLKRRLRLHSNRHQNGFFSGDQQERVSLPPSYADLYGSGPPSYAFTDLNHTKASV